MENFTKIATGFYTTTENDHTKVYRLIDMEINGKLDLELVKIADTREGLDSYRSEKAELLINGDNDGEPATDNQIAFIKKLADWRDIPAEYIEALTKRQASAFIDILKSAPYLAEGIAKFEAEAEDPTTEHKIQAVAPAVAEIVELTTEDIQEITKAGKEAKAKMKAREAVAERHGITPEQVYKAYVSAAKRKALDIGAGKAPRSPRMAFSWALEIFSK